MTPTDHLSASVARVALARSPLAADKIRGVKQIAEYIGENERRTQYLCEKRLIPVGKEGSSYVASKRALDAHYASLTSGTTPQTETNQP